MELGFRKWYSRVGSSVLMARRIAGLAQETRQRHILGCRAIGQLRASPQDASGPEMVFGRCYQQ